MQFCTSKILILKILLITHTVGVPLSVYCKFNKKNLPCYKKCVRSKACGKTTLGFQSLSPLDGKYLEVTINMFRNMVAGGDFYAEPSAQDMYVMKYDPECEFLAGCVVKMCKSNIEQLLISRDGTLLGYNTYGKIIGVENSRLDNLLDIEEGFVKWIEQGISNVTLTQSAVVNDYTKVPYEFMQMVWGDVKWFGCAALVSQPNDAWYYFTLVCVFKPMMDIHHKPAYTEGEPGAKCKKKSDYPNLCAHQYFPEFKPPVLLNKGVHPKMNILLQLIVCALIYRK